MTSNKCKLIDLPKISDPRGNLSFIEGTVHIPFDIKRVYFLYDVPGGSYRGSHAHRDLEQFVVAMSGSFDVHADDGFTRTTFHLNRSYYGLFLPRMTWRELSNFSSGAVCVVLASKRFSEDDYIRNYEEFIGLVKAHENTFSKPQ